MIVHEQLLWVVIGIFYLLQHFKLLKRNEAYLHVSAKGGVFASIPALPFETIKGILYIINPLVPHRVLFRCDWGMSDAATRSAVRQTWVRMRRTSKDLMRIRLVAVLGFVLFFLVCPVLTWQRGLEKTFWIAIPAWLFLYGAVVYLLLTHRFEEKKNVWLLLFECLVCPAYIAALPRLLDENVTHGVDMARLVKKYGTDAEWQRLKLVLEKRIETEVYNNPALKDQLEQYRFLVLQ